MPTNNRVSHFVENYDRACTFCTLKGDRPCPEESFVHKFFGCGHTSALINNLVAEWGLVNFNTTQKREFIFGNRNDSQITGNNFVKCVKWVFLLLIWESKLKKMLRSWNSLKTDLIFLVKVQLDSSQKLREEKAALNLNFTRYWP